MRSTPPSRPGDAARQTERDPTALLSVRRLRAGFAERTILNDVSFEVARTGITGVLGPGGVGKSTLLRSLARWNEAIPSFWTKGTICLEGRDLQHEVPMEEARARVALLAQKARLYTATILDNAIASIRPEGPLSLAQKRQLAEEVLVGHGLWELLGDKLHEPVISLSLGEQRVLSMARLSSGGAQCLLADEPLRDLADEDAALVERVLRALAERLAIIMVTHDQRVARRLCHTVCLITAGEVVEYGGCAEFFSQPRTELGRRYLSTGNCWPDEPPVSEAAPVSPRPVPKGFHWVIKGLLGGAQWPGLLGDVYEDVSGLQALGVRVLISLTETAFDPQLLDAHGLESLHFPIEDMGVPELHSAARLCQRVSSWLDEDRPVVFHCKAGLGRTGTLLACVLVCRGAEPVRAIHEVRLVNPHYIQSERQLNFIAEFAEFVSPTC